MSVLATDSEIRRSARLDKKKFSKLRNECCKQEAALRKGHADLAMTKSKLTVAMKQLLVQIGHVDPDVADSGEGFPLVG